jgi:ferredoxin
MHTAFSGSFFSRSGKTANERKPFANMQHIPLGYAYLCQDCNAVGNCAEKCPACASEVLMCLAGVLNREVGADVGPSYVSNSIGSHAA